MASPSIPKESITVPISREEFDRFETAQARIGGLLWIIRHGSFDDPGSIVAELEFLMAPHHSELGVVAEQLQRRFDKAEKEKEPEGPDYFSRRN